MIMTMARQKRRLLCIGTEAFSFITPPPDLQTELIHVFLDRTTGITSDGRRIEDVIAIHINDVNGMLVVPQTEVTSVCNSQWLQECIKKLPVGLLWFDYNVYYNIADSMKDCLHIALDNQHKNETNMMSLWTPICMGEITPPQKQRDINIAFYGKVDCDQRTAGLSFLLNRDIPVFTIGNASWNTVDYGVLYNYMRNTKIVINFANNRFHPDTHLQGLKGRTLEAMNCGAMVIENDNSHTKKYFKPNEDIVFFDSLEDLYDKIRFYMSNDGERIRIANNGLQRCLSEYTVHNWWRLLIPRLLTFNKVKM